MQLDSKKSRAKDWNLLPTPRLTSDFSDVFFMTNFDYLEFLRPPIIVNSFGVVYCVSTQNTGLRKNGEFNETHGQINFSTIRLCDKCCDNIRPNCYDEPTK